MDLSSDSSSSSSYYYYYLIKFYLGFWFPGSLQSSKGQRHSSADIFIVGENLRFCFRLPVLLLETKHCLVLTLLIVLIILKTVAISGTRTNEGYYTDIYWTGHYDGFGNEIFNRIYVQRPPPGILTRNALEWKENVAYILHNRVCDFVEGESIMESHPTNFNVVKHKSHAPNSLRLPKADSFLDSRLYYCAYGPESGPRASSTSSTKAPQKRMRESKKRGCTCSFQVNQLYYRPELAKITYKNMRHVDIQGNVCHGIDDVGVKGKTYLTAPHVSKQMRDWIHSRIVLGRTPSQVMLEHHKNVESDTKQPVGFSRPMTTRDKDLKIDTIENIARSHVRSMARLYELDEHNVGKDMSRCDALIEKTEKTIRELLNDNPSLKPRYASMLLALIFELGKSQEKNITSDLPSSRSKKFAVHNTGFGPSLIRMKPLISVNRETCKSKSHGKASDIDRSQVAKTIHKKLTMVQELTKS